MDDRPLEHDAALVRGAAALLGRRPDLVHRQPRALSPGSGPAVREPGIDGDALRGVTDRGNRDRPAPANRVALDRTNHRRRFHPHRAAPGMVAGSLRGSAGAGGGHLTAAAATHTAAAQSRPALVAGATGAAARLRPAARHAVAGVWRRIPAPRPRAFGGWRRRPGLVG